MSKTEGKLEAIDGNEAASYAAYGLCEFVIIFPITPSSTMAEKCDAWSASGKKNAFGTVPVVYQMESEAGVAGALHGCGATGGLGVTFTSSQGLMLMIPNLYKLAGELIPAVIHVSARQVGTGATSIYCDHSDVMTVRSTGMAFVCSASAQEAMDFAAASHLATIETSLPTLHFFDGFTTSHSLQSCVRLPYELLGKLANKEKISAFRKTALDPSRPHERGCIVGRQEWMQMAEATNSVYQQYPAALEQALESLAAYSGRHYKLYEWVGAPDAEYAIVIMGSAGLTVEEVVDYMVAAGAKVGVLRVRLFRPWNEERFLAALPKTVRRVAVMDRCREAGASGEPLYLDVASTILGSGRAGNMVVCGGRYGIGDKFFVPAHVAAVFANLRAETPKRKFTVGVVDDVTGLSLAPVDPPKAPAGTPVPRQASIWGMGSDGSVGACHMALRLLTVGAGLQVQGQFYYTAHKSGGVTTSHMRFGHAPIKGQYAVTLADYIGVHNHSYVGRYDCLANAADGAYVVVNAAWKKAEDVPLPWHRQLARRHIKLFSLDASSFKRAGSLALTAAFLKLASGDAITPEKAIELLKAESAATFAKKGEAVVKANLHAIDEALAQLHQISIPAEWENAPEVPLGQGLSELPDTPFDTQIKGPLTRLAGDDIPVSAFRDLVPGCRAPASTTRHDKRAIADAAPVWTATKCTQCNICSTVCPHAVIRPFLLTKEEAERAQLTSEQVKPALGAGGEAGYVFRVQVSPNDCTGCGVCASMCPCKCLELKPLPEVAATEAKRWAILSETVPSRPDVYPRDNVRGLQFVQPLFEFNGACGGCGEAAYIKMLSQIVGERAVFVCASGCNVAYSFAFGANPYCTTPEGRGPAVAHSLFEDTAEFGYGSAYALLVRRNLLAEKVKEFLASAEAASVSAELREHLAKWLEHKEDVHLSDVERKIIMPLLQQAPKTPALDELRELSVYLTKATVWCIGGDGWASDIDYGGLDHVLSLGLPVKMLIMDTEVYSNTGGQQSKATPTGAVHKFAAGGKKAPKKDLGLTFLQSHQKVAYVATICSSDSIAQSFRAFSEAEAFPGPAVVVAYSPCIEHGIEGASPAAWTTQAKRAVDSGYWPMWRWDPRTEKLQIDAPAQLKPKIPLTDFISHENRFMRLKREHPEAAVTLIPNLEKFVQQRLEKIASFAGITLAAPAPAKN